MTRKIGRCERVSVSTTETEIGIGYRSFLIENLGDEPVFVSAIPGAQNGFAIPGGKMIGTVLTAEKLYVKSAGAGDLRLLYLDED